MQGEIEYNYVVLAFVLLLFKGATVGYYLLLLTWKENVAGDGR